MEGRRCKGSIREAAISSVGTRQKTTEKDECVERILLLNYQREERKNNPANQKQLKPKYEPLQPEVAQNIPGKTVALLWFYLNLGSTRYPLYIIPSFSDISIALCTYFFNVHLSHLQVVVLSFLLSFEVKSCKTTQIFLANSFVNSGTTTNTFSVVMCSVCPPISLGFDIPQYHVFNCCW